MTTNNQTTTILTTNEVAEMLRMHPATICRYATRGVIPCVRLGSVFRFRKESIEDWLHSKDDVEDDDNAT